MITCRKFAAFRTDSDRTNDEYQSPHYAFQGEDKLKNRATADVFFWDGTQEIKADWKRTETVDDATSMTESSSSGVSSCDDVSELWSLPRSSAWESVGDQERAPFEHRHRLETFGPSQSLIETKIPIDVACRYSHGGPIAEVHETDIVEVRKNLLVSSVLDVVNSSLSHIGRSPYFARHGLDPAPTRCPLSDICSTFTPPDSAAQGDSHFDGECARGICFECASHARLEV